jgi:hypothetical protein
MQLRVFKSVVNSKIDDVVNDIKKAASMYYKGNRKPLKENAKLRTPENIRHIEEFDKVVSGATWKLGDAERIERRQMELSAPKPVVRPAEPREPKEPIDSPDFKANTFIKKD